MATIQHSAGDRNWQPVYSETTGRAWAIWGSGPADVYAIVSPIAMSDPPAHLVHSMPAGTWVTESLADNSATLVALWGSGAGDVYAGGWYATSAGRRGVLYHSSGDGRWMAVNLPGVLYNLSCIWGSSATDVYVGVFDVSNGPLLLHGQP
jgi:hypothetical protein